MATINFSGNAKVTEILRCFQISFGFLHDEGKIFIFPLSYKNPSKTNAVTLSALEIANLLASEILEAGELLPL